VHEQVLRKQSRLGTFYKFPIILLGTFGERSDAVLFSLDDKLLSLFLSFSLFSLLQAAGFDCRVAILFLNGQIAILIQQNNMFIIQPLEFAYFETL